MPLLKLIADRIEATGAWPAAAHTMLSARRSGGHPCFFRQIFMCSRISQRHSRPRFTRCLNPLNQNEKARDGPHAPRRMPVNPAPHTPHACIAAMNF